MKNKNKNMILGINLDQLIEESVKALFESNDDPKDKMKELLKQKKQEQSSSDRKKAYKDSKSKKELGEISDADDPLEDTKPAETKPVKVSEDKLPEIDTEKIIDKLNTIRSGKSLKDPETQKSLKAYFQNLNGAERIALYAFLTGLDKVVGGTDGSKVATPHADPYSIDMEKEKKTKKKPKGEKSTGGDGEDSPIIVGESASKEKILHYIRRNK